MYGHRSVSVSSLRAYKGRGLNCPYFVGCRPPKAKGRAQPIRVRDAGCLMISLEFSTFSYRHLLSTAIDTSRLSLPPPQPHYLPYSLHALELHIMEPPIRHFKHRGTEQLIVHSRGTSLVASSITYQCTSHTLLTIGRIMFQPRNPHEITFFHLFSNI
jgi:hypothetical protein